MKIRNLEKLLPLTLVVIAGAIAFKLIPQNSSPKDSESWFVIKVTDGDTIKLNQENGKKLTIRLCGIDAPERAQPLGKESQKNLERLVAETDNNRIAITPIEHDRFGRMVAEAFIILPDGSEKSLNEEQLTSGLAYFYKQYTDDCPNKDAFEKAEQIGREKHVGVWNGNHIKPWDYRGSKR